MNTIVTSVNFSAFKQNTSYSTFDKIHFVVTQKSVLLTNINTSPSEALVITQKCSFRNDKLKQQIKNLYIVYILSGFMISLAMHVLFFAQQKQAKYISLMKQQFVVTHRHTILQETEKNMTDP
jgi:hypothetical protein